MSANEHFLVFQRRFGEQEEIRERVWVSRLPNH